MSNDAVERSCRLLSGAIVLYDMGSETDDQPIIVHVRLQPGRYSCIVADTFCYEMFDVRGALVEAANPGLTEAQRADLLKYIQESLSEFASSKNLDFELIAPIVHHLFAHFPAQRTVIVSICVCLEALSVESITTRFHFDHLLCCLMEHRSSSEGSVASETERQETLSVILKYIKLLLALRKHVPTSIVRSIVCVCESAKGTENEQYIPVFVNYLCEAVLCCDVASIPELCPVLVAELVRRPNPAVLKLFTYCMEIGIPLIRSPKILWPLMGPLAQQNSTDVLASNEDETSNAVIDSIGYLLQAWPGLMCFGIQGGALVDIIRCVPKEMKLVIKLLRKTLMLERDAPSVTDPFRGLLLDTLLKEGLIQALNQVASKPSVSSFLNEIMLYTTHSVVAGVEMTKHAYRAPIIQTPHIPNALLFDLAQNTNSTQQIVSVVAIEKMLQLEQQKWDWAALLMVFTVILPHNEQEASGSQAQEIYSKMFNFFSGPFLKVKPGKCGNMTEPLFAMLQLLMSKKKWGLDVIKNNLSFCSALSHVMDLVGQNGSLESNSPQWALFKCIGLILANSDTPEVLSGMRCGGTSIWDKLTALCNNCTSDKICSSILEILSFDSFLGNCVPLVQYFLMSENPKVHETAINELSRKRQNAKEAINVIFDTLLLTHIVSISDDAKLADRLILDLNFFAELVTVDDAALDLIASERASQHIDDILRKHARFVVAILMSNEKMLDRPWIEEEIKWWMSTGNREYVRMYDTAVECSFAGTLDVSTTKQPAIVNYGGTTTIPPHLFSKMSATKKGMEKLVPLIPQLLDTLTSESTDNLEEIRAILFALGHFASSPHTMDYVEQYKIPEVMMDVVEECDSYVLRGTLVAALSLFKQSRYVSSVLRGRKWQLFRFGRHISVIPENARKWLGPLPQTPLTPQTVADIPKYKAFIDCLKMLSNSLVSKKAIEYLRARKSQNDPALVDPELALFAFNLISQFYYEPVSRRTLFSLFGPVPLIPWQPPQWHDTLATAQLSARLFTKSDEIPTRTLEEIRQMNPAPRCPECFLSDEDFAAVCGCSRDDFYAKSAGDQKQIRETIFISAPVTTPPETHPSTDPN